MHFVYRAVPQTVCRKPRTSMALTNLGEQANSAGQWRDGPGKSCDNLSQMFRKTIRRYAIVLAAWLPFFALWVLFAMSYAHDRIFAVLVPSLISMGSAGLLGIAVWHICRRWPWPLGFSLRFYLLQLLFALLYAVAWTAAVYGLEFLRLGSAVQGFWSW